MKKILFAVAVALITAVSFSANAQSLLLGTGDFTALGSNPFYTTLDTVTNTGTKTYTQAISRRYETVTFQVNMLKISGTTSSVTVKFQASADGGNNYVTLYTDTMADASGNFSHTWTGNPYTHWRVLVTGAGTQSSSYRAYVLVR